MKQALTLFSVLFATIIPGTNAQACVSLNGRYSVPSPRGAFEIAMHQEGCEKLTRTYSYSQSDTQSYTNETKGLLVDSTRKTAYNKVKNYYLGENLYITENYIDDSKANTEILSLRKNGDLEVSVIFEPEFEKTQTKVQKEVTGNENQNTVVLTRLPDEKAK